MDKEMFAEPVGLTSQFNFQRVATEFATDNATELGIPKLITDALIAGSSDYESKYVVTRNPSTTSHAAVVARDAAWDVLEILIVSLYNTYFLNNKKLTPNDRATLLIHNIGGGHSQFAAPTTTPIVSAVSETESMLFIVYSDSSVVTRHGKPSGVGFLEIRGKIGGTKPVTITDCPESYNVSRSHEGILFTPEQRGVEFFGFARWVNKNGKSGPWGNMFGNKIP